MKLDLNYSLKFYWGAVLIVLSVILGTLTKVVFFYPTISSTTRLTMVVTYIISWPILFLGVYWMGKEYADSLRKYLQYKYYHKYVRAGTKKAYEVTKNKTQRVKQGVKTKIENSKEKARSRKLARKNKKIKK
ncbi:hypothetical protein HOE37_05880 [Candidatus Woesearchaeota archaeon]|jgi:hypothetical protein|nr:hypothetical protein [Candidatus Woesearchaeota archaeon]MBT4111363.1 hypothetical protein [Candidatus Woesearchaeota archaeon]MBT4336458.1 hypothetical protein [Candidatus Woesearchaeota archaeon]MBT4469871.1 hypothetical protein [Candidatus Woesearchaeota archaeon]MBT6744458.1 hypothetical protein [Candidatus Woesearchaeota archaeon]